MRISRAKSPFALTSSLDESSSGVYRVESLRLSRRLSIVILTKHKALSGGGLGSYSIAALVSGDVNHPPGSRARAAGAAFASNARNHNLRLAQRSFLGAWTAEWAFTVGLGIIAYRDGGARV